MATRGRTNGERESGAFARRLRQKAAERAAKRPTPKQVDSALSMLAPPMPVKENPYLRILAKIDAEREKHGENR